MSTPILVDRYTPRAPRSTEQHTRARLDNMGSYSPMGSLQLLSSSISLQEDQFGNLARSLDVNLEILDCDNGTGDYSYGASVHPEKRNSPNLVPHQRSGRLSPTVLQMILSSNDPSFFSEPSSAVDTSYDSELYRWLGVTEFSAKDSPPRSRRLSYYPSNKNYSPLDVSTASSPSAYSQPSPLRSPGATILPLSPPATARPPFADSLHENSAEAENSDSFYSNSKAHANFRLSRCSTNEDQEAEYSLDLDFAAPLLLRNLSLQHHFPSATVLRQFHRVINELQGNYACNDRGNNVPKWTNRRPVTLHAPRRSCDSESSLAVPPPLPLQKQAPPAATISPKSTRNNARTSAEYTSRTTQELYNEMASILFGQVTQDEKLADSLRRLADRLETLARKKHTAALLIALRARDILGKSH